MHPGMLSPRPGLGLEAQKTGFGLVTVVASASYSLASWPRSF